MTASRSHDPAIVIAVATALELAVNRALELAPSARKDLAELGGTLLAIECTKPEVEMFMVIEPCGSLTIKTYSEVKATTRVRGSLDDFLSLATAEDPAATLINSDLEIIGNSAPLVAVQQIITRMDIDWEAPLVAVLGDVAGHQFAQLLRGAFSWGQAAGKSLRRQLSEFILEEGRLSPPKAELENFYTEVQSLSLRVERLQSRLARLAKRVSESA